MAFALSERRRAGSSGQKGIPCPGTTYTSARSGRVSRY